MASLGKWQFVSLVSRFIALFLGLVQSVIIARILTVSEFGVVGIVGAVGALFGIAQHLGLASGTTREISATKNPNDIFKIFISSVVIKYVITFPLALGLFVLAPYLATVVYKHPEITFPLRLYALVLIVQGVQSIFNSVIAGLHKFKRLFLYQALIAVVSLVFYIPLVFLYKVNGYFIALTVFNLISSLSLGYLALWPLRHELKSPAKNEFTKIFKNILVLSLGIYFVKVLYTIWYKFGQITLGYFEPLEVVGIFSFALLYASKLMTISDALTDVNLPVFSKEFAHNFENFKKLFHDNFDKLYFIILFCALSASFFVKEILIFVDLYKKYSSSIFIVLPLVLSFAFYSYINIIKSSILIPAKMITSMVIGYITLVFYTVLSYFVLLLKFDSLSSMSFSMLLGSVLAFFTLFVLIKKELNFFILDTKFIALSLLAFVILPVHFVVSDLMLRFVFYIVYSSTFLYALERYKVFSVVNILKRFRK